MKLILSFLAFMLCFLSFSLYAISKVSVYKYKVGRKINQDVNFDGEINVKLENKLDDYGNTVETTKNYYGIDLHGFSELPHEVYVLP